MSRVFIFLFLLAFTFCEGQDSGFKKLSDAALEQTRENVAYDPQYFRIAYPLGDIPKDKGVCTDLVIRSYRKLGIDLQQLVHEDMQKNKKIYDSRRRTEKLDSNIDHRRCPNLITFFTRQKAHMPVTSNESGYLPGDLVFWDIAAGHVGIVIDEKVPGTNRNYVVHNICCGNQKEDFLFKSRIVAHFRWMPANTK